MPDRPRLCEEEIIMTEKKSSPRLQDIISVLAQAGDRAPQTALELLRPLAPDACIDALGSVTATIGRGRKTILLDAHIDQIGLTVTASAGDGFWYVAKVGGMDRRVLVGKPVIIYGREEVCAVIASVPPHLASKEDGKLPDFDELLIDTGLTEAESTRLVAPGDRVLIDSVPLELQNDRITAQALDNRCGVAAVLHCLELLRGESLPCRVAVQFSTFEETGGAGAQTAAFAADAQEAAVVDVSFARTPGAPANVRARLGGGPMIGVAASLDRRIGARLQSIAQQAQIPYQIEAMGGSTGTNADAIAVTRGGVAVGLVSIPQKNMHTGVEIVDCTDVARTGQLLAAYIRAAGKEG